MEKIFKYPVFLQDEFSVNLPEGAQILSVQMQGGKPFFWALIDTDAPLKKYTFIVVGTGNPVKPGDKQFVGTFQMYGGELVFHLFMIKQ